MPGAWAALVGSVFLVCPSVAFVVVHLRKHCGDGWLWSVYQQLSGSHFLHMSACSHFLSVCSLLQAKAAMMMRFQLQRKPPLQRLQLLCPLQQKRQRRQRSQRLWSRHLLERRHLLQRRWRDCKAGAPLLWKKSALEAFFAFCAVSSVEFGFSCSVHAV